MLSPYLGLFFLLLLYLTILYHFEMLSNCEQHTLSEKKDLPCSVLVSTIKLDAK